MTFKNAPPPQDDVIDDPASFSLQKHKLRQNLQKLAGDSDEDDAAPLVEKSYAEVGGLC